MRRKREKTINNPSLEVSCPEEKKTHAQVYVWTPDKPQRQTRHTPAHLPTHNGWEKRKKQEKEIGSTQFEINRVVQLA